MSNLRVKVRVDPYISSPPLRKWKIAIPYYSVTTSVSPEDILVLNAQVAGMRRSLGCQQSAVWDRFPSKPSLEKQEFFAC